MDLARYYLALIALVAYPAAITYWLLIHPFVGFWRRIGLGVTYALVLPAITGVGYVMFQLREPLLALDFGTHYGLLVVALPLLVWGMYIDVVCRRSLKVRILVGIPELAPDRSPTELLTGGIYAKMRHPRYVSAFLGGVATALIANFAAVYVICVLVVPCLGAIVLLEERELRARFGEEYERYCRRVPRFLPRMGTGSG